MAANGSETAGLQLTGGAGAGPEAGPPLGFQANILGGPSSSEVPRCRVCGHGVGLRDFPANFPFDSQCRCPSPRPRPPVVELPPPNERWEGWQGTRLVA